MHTTSHKQPPYSLFTLSFLAGSWCGISFKPVFTLHPCQVAEAAAAALDAGAESLERQAEGVAAALGAELASGCARCATTTQWSCS